MGSGRIRSVFLPARHFNRHPALSSIRLEGSRMRPKVIRKPMPPASARAQPRGETPLHKNSVSAHQPQGCGRALTLSVGTTGRQLYRLYPQSLRAKPQFFSTSSTVRGSYLYLFFLYPRLLPTYCSIAVRASSQPGSERVR